MDDHEKRIRNLEQSMAVVLDQVKNHIPSDMRFLRSQVWGLYSIVITILLALMMLHR